MHEPFEKEHPTAETIVVFTHGFIGSPGQFEDLADFAYQNGCSALSLRLPGHGGNARELAKFRLKDWEEHVEGEIRRVSADYRNIILVGHSIGGLMSLNASLNQSYKIKSVLLISSPLKLRYSFFTLKIGIRLMLFPKGGGEILDAYRKSSGVSFSSIFSSILWLKQAGDINRLIAKTKVNLAEITVPVTVINSEKDETASPKSPRLFERGLVNTDKKIIVLKKSRHAYFDPDERAVIRRELLALINAAAEK